MLAVVSCPPRSSRSFRRTLLSRRDGARLHAGSTPLADLDRIRRKMAFLVASGVPERDAAMAMLTDRALHGRQRAGGAGGHRPRRRRGAACRCAADRSRVGVRGGAGPHPGRSGTPHRGVGRVSTDAGPTADGAPSHAATGSANSSAGPGPV
nr:TetR/AcrR family transcriptional regulator C-terminal domain-containing protein [Streptomyces corynorhini]